MDQFYGLLTSKLVKQNECQLIFLLLVLITIDLGLSDNNSFN